MPRNVTKGVTVRQQVQPAPAPTGLQVNARPVDTVVPGNVSDSSLLINSLASIRPQLQQYIGAQADQANQASTLKGAKAAMTLSDVERKVAIGNMKREQSPFFQQGYMQMHGQLEASKFKNELESDLADPAKFNPDTDDIHAFTQERLQASLQGMDDQHFLNTYLPHAENAVAAVKARYSAEKSAEVLAKTQNGQLDLMMATTAEASKAQRPITIEERNKHYQDGRAMGITYAQSDAMLFEAVKIQALSGGGDPTALDVFNERSVDGTQPGMAHSAKWAEKIRDVRHQAERLVAAAKEQKDHVANLEAWNKESTILATGKGDRNIHFQRLLGYVKDGRMQEGTVHSLMSDFDTAKKFNDSVDSTLTSLRAGDPAATANVEKKVKVAAMTKLVDGIKTQYKDDVNGFAGALVHALGPTGEMPEEIKQSLNTVSPSSSPKLFQQNAALVSEMMARNPEYVQRNVDHDMSVMYSVYHDAIRLDGMTPEQATREAIEVGNPDSRKRLAAIMSPEVKASIDTTAKSVASNEWFGHDAAVNTTYVKDTIDRLMTSYMLRRRGSPAMAAEWATERFKASHTNVNGRWLEHDGQPGEPLAHPVFPEAAKQFVVKYAESLKKAGEPVSKDGYFIAPDYMTRADGSYGVFREGSLIPEPIRVDPKKLRDDALRAKRPNWQGIQADQAKAQSASPTSPFDINP